MEAGAGAAEARVRAGWAGRSAREVVRDAAAKGLVRAALAHLRHERAISPGDAETYFRAEVSTWVLQLLSRQQIHKALHILNKVGIEPERHLLELARESADIELRDYVVQQLINIRENAGSFKLEELEWKRFLLHWNLLKYLEKSFECEGTFKQNKVFGFGREMVVVTETEIKALTVEKIEGYPESWKCKIAAYLFFDTFVFSLLDFLTPLSIWNHLVDHNKAMILVRWINMHTSELVRDKNSRYQFFNNDGFVKKLFSVETQHLKPEQLQELDQKFRSWPVTREMIDSVSNRKCYAYTKMCIYDTLCSYGIVLEEESSILHAVVSRLARTQNLRILDDIFKESCATMSKKDFYIEVAKYCVTNKLYNALTVCVDSDEVSGVEEPCIRLWLQFKSIEQTSDRQSHVLPIYNTCRQIDQDIDGFISSNPHLVLGMVLLDDNKQLFDIFTKEPLKFDGFVLHPKVCRDKLLHLSSVYNKYKNMWSHDNDINVYQLLSGYRGLDVSKLFEFQLMTQSQHSLSVKPERRSLGDLTLGTLPARSDMPHFASSKLMKRFGYVAKLNHMYYLRQNRACAASQAFMRQQYQAHNRLQEQACKSACCEAHALALHQWSQPAAAACTISFMSMLGCTATRARVHISAANMMHARMVHADGLTEDAAARLVTGHMLELCRNNETAQQILTLLEEISLSDVEAQSSGVDMSRIIYSWQTAVKFAMLQGQPYPERQLQQFVSRQQWLPFLVFGDVFRYPQQQMLRLSAELRCPYAEHVRHIILHRSMEDVSVPDKESGKSSKEGQRRLSRLSSAESSPTHNTSFVFPEGGEGCEGGAGCAGELWEMLATCHASEDPPGALIRAAGARRAPLLALLATCYEVNAVGVCWAYWVLASLGDAVSPTLRDSLHWDVSEPFTLEDFHQLTALCLQHRHLRTLHHSMLIFFPDCPITILTAFLWRCAWLLRPDEESAALATRYAERCHRRCSTAGTARDLHGAPAWMSHAHTLQRAGVVLAMLTLERCFHSALHQKHFLKCLIDANFGKDFSVPCPDLEMVYKVLSMSMETSCVVDAGRLVQEDSAAYLVQCVDGYVQRGEYEHAARLAGICRLPLDEVLTAEWRHKHQELTMLEPADKERSLYIARCSEAFERGGVGGVVAVPFLIGCVHEVTDPEQKFYSYRIIFSWFDGEHTGGGKGEREELEREMWKCYLRARGRDVFLQGHRATLQYVLGGQADRALAEKMGALHADTPFNKLLAQIEIEASVNGPSTSTVSTEQEEEEEEEGRVERLRTGLLFRLLELGLVAEAWRAARLLGAGEDSPVELVRACLRLAEGAISPYSLPPHLRLLISSPTLRSRLSGSHTCEAGFEEVVVIAERGGVGAAVGAHVAGREDADRLSALEALAARSGLALARQVASLYRISLQLGWPYAQVLKYRGSPLELVDYVCGRARMPLAGLVFKTYHLSNKQIASYLCLELVGAIISPHLLKSGGSQAGREHFQYTLWGYPLHSDMHMFLNLRPAANSLLGRLILDHLLAFRRIYKGTLPDSHPPTCTERHDDSLLDLQTLIDEEYQTVESEEVESMSNISTRTEGSFSETESVMSEATTVYSCAPGSGGGGRGRNLFDVISGSTVHVPGEVKANVRRITKGAKLSTKQVNVICIELLVGAHECFSCACDTEGVAVVLRSAQALTHHLLAARSWRLMVRLVTGLGRYAEMAYVFQMLRDNHQFEFLLGQFDYMLGQDEDRIAGFKQGLLEFLKTRCPGDTETYCLVALHFNMHTEAAHVKRKQARDLVVTLHQVALDALSGPPGTRKLPHRAVPTSMPLLLHDNNTTRLLLETALEQCTDAAGLFLQGGCSEQARESASAAQQIALQLSLLRPGAPAPLLLHATAEQVSTLVSHHLGMMEGLVLMAARADGAGGATAGGAAWRELAYARMLRHDRAYIRDLAARRPDLAQQLLLRYKSEKKTTLTTQAAAAELSALCR